MPGHRASCCRAQAAPSPAPPAPALPSLSCPRGSPGLGRAGQPKGLCDIPPGSVHWRRTEAQGSCCQPLGLHVLTGRGRHRGPGMDVPTHLCAHTPLHLRETPCTQAHSRHTCAQGCTEALEAAGRDASLRLLCGGGGGGNPTSWGPPQGGAQGHTQDSQPSLSSAICPCPTASAARGRPGTPHPSLPPPPTARPFCLRGTVESHPAPQPPGATTSHPMQATCPRGS